MANLDEDIKRITDECLSDGTIDEILRKKIVAGFEGAISDSFKWGELNKAIQTKVKSVLVPYIENYDMSEYIVKLDTVLTDIINNTMLVDNKTLLENFKSLMTEPNRETITVSELFDIYNKWVAKDIETSGRDVDFESSTPQYVSIETNVNFEEEEQRRWSSFTYGTLELTVDEDDKEETFNRCIRLSRWNDDKKEGWNINYSMPSDLNSLRNMNDFDIFMMTLERARVRIILDVKYDSEEVTPDTEPEPTYE